MPRRTQEERRRDYLDIGAQLVAEASRSMPPDPGLAVAHVKLLDVARRAGVTKGALYHLWPSQEDFWHDLVVHLFVRGHVGGTEQAAVDALALRSLLEEPGEAALVEYANSVFDRVRGEPGAYLQIAVYAYLFDDAELRAWLDADFRAGLARFTSFLTWGLAQVGRRMRPGADELQFATAVIVLLQGLLVEHRIHPSAVADVTVEGTRVTAFAAGVRALLEEFTVPLPPDAPPGRMPV
jgi:AcrR family transcriptional regulator